MDDNHSQGRGISPNNNGRTSPPQNGSIPGAILLHIIERIEQQDQDQPDPQAVLHPIYDFEGVAGPSQPEPLIDSALMGLDDDDDSEHSDRLPIIPEDTILRTSGSFNRDDGWREYLNELSMAIEEAEADVPDSPLLESLPETIIGDLGQAKDEIQTLKQLTLMQQRQLNEYKLLNEELRKKIGRKDRKINRLEGDLQECLGHRAGLEQQNRKMQQWLQANAPDWEDGVSSDSPPASPPGRTGTLVRAKRRPVHQISPSSSDSGSKRSCQHSPEIRRADSPDDKVADTSDVFRTPSTTSPQKRSLSDSGSNKRRRSTTPPPTVSVASVVSPVVLPSPILPVDTNPPGDDGGDDDGPSSDGRRGGRPPRAPRRPRSPRARRVLGPRAGAFIPPAPAGAQEQPRIWHRGPGRTTNLRPRIPLNLNVDQWFAHHLGRI